MTTNPCEKENFIKDFSKKFEALYSKKKIRAFSQGKKTALDPITFDIIHKEMLMENYRSVNLLDILCVNK